MTADHRHRNNTPAKRWYGWGAGERQPRPDQEDPMTVHTDHRKPTLRLINPATLFLFAIGLDAALVWGLSKVTGWPLLASTLAVLFPLWALFTVVVWYDGRHPNL